MRMVYTNLNSLILCLSSVCLVSVVWLLWSMILYSLVWMAIVTLSVICLVGLLLAIMLAIALSPYIARSLVTCLTHNSRTSVSWSTTRSGMIRSSLHHPERISSIREARIYITV